MAPALLLALVSLGVGACERASTPPVAAGRLLVFATFYPLYEFTRQVGGDRAEVRSLVPPGVEPHDWEPSPRELVDLRRARMLVYNGAGLEPWVERVLRDLAVKDLLAVNTTQGLSVALHERDPRGPGKAGYRPARGPSTDPHVWLDPLLALAQVEAIRAAFQQVDPVHAQTYETNAAAFVAKLRALDDAYAGGLRKCARRDVVTAHAAFGYLTRRYGLTQIPLLGVSPEAEPSPADMARLVQIARQRRVRYVFAETILSTRIAETLAREVGANVLILNPLEGLTPEEQAAGKGYLSVMAENLHTLRIGLECA